MKTSYGTALPVYCSTSFGWKGNMGSCNDSDLIKVDTEHMVGDFNGVLIKSAKTGKVKYFNPVPDEDGYDGEFMIYSSDDQYFVQIWRY